MTVLFAFMAATAGLVAGLAFERVYDVKLVPSGAELAWVRK
jgi:hypothetical protein